MTDQTRETTQLPRTTQSRVPLSPADKAAVIVEPRGFQWPDDKPKKAKPRRAAEPEGYVVRGWVFALLVMLAIIPTILVIAAEVGW